MPLKFGVNGLEEVPPNKSSNYWSENMPLRIVCFKFLVNHRKKIDLLVKKRLIYGYSEFIRFAFKNQLKKGFTNILADDVRLYTEKMNGSPKQQLTAKFPQLLKQLAVDFCFEYNLNFSQYLRYCVYQELQDWEKFMEVKK